MATTTGPTNQNGNQSKRTHQRGSGHDLNSDTSRLSDEDNLQDKTEEDSFPASDPPSHSPVSGIGRSKSDVTANADFKNNGAKQFEYGRQTEAKTLHIDPNTNRLRKGNPDVGNVDLGNIEADKPAQPDDNDHFD